MKCARLASVQCMTILSGALLLLIALGCTSRASESFGPVRAQLEHTGTLSRTSAASSGLVQIVASLRIHNVSGSAARVVASASCPFAILVFSDSLRSRLLFSQEDSGSLCTLAATEYVIAPRESLRLERTASIEADSLQGQSVLFGVLRLRLVGGEIVDVPVDSRVVTTKAAVELTELSPVP